MTNSGITPSRFPETMNLRRAALGRLRPASNILPKPMWIPLQTFRYRRVEYRRRQFPSYVGLFSFYDSENWCYQASYVSSNTPWFFTGMRVQFFPNDTLKIEPWIINGWQTYGMFNEGVYGFPWTWVSRSVGRQTRIWCLSSTNTRERTIPTRLIASNTIRTTARSSSTWMIRSRTASLKWLSL